MSDGETASSRIRGLETLWSLLPLLLIGGLLTIGGPISHYWNGPAALLSLGIGTSLLFKAHGKRWFKVFRKDLLAEEHRQAAQMASTGARVFPYAGWMGVLVGVIEMLSNLDDPSVIGPAMAVALLSALYGHGIAALVWVPWRQYHLERAVARDPLLPRRIRLSSKSIESAQERLQSELEVLQEERSPNTVRARLRSAFSPKD